MSTDDSNIIDLADNCGIETIIRPEYLCEDDSTSESAHLHAIHFIRSEYKFSPDIIVFTGYVTVKII